MANRQGVGVELRRHSELPRLGKRPTPMPPRPSKMDVCTCTVRTSKVRWRQAVPPRPRNRGCRTLIVGPGRLPVGGTVSPHPHALRPCRRWV